MIIGLTGRKQSGKSTAAKYLKARGFLEVSFADPIRRFIADFLGVTLDQLELMKEEPSFALGDKTPRFAMQTLGTEWGRKMMSPALWTNRAMIRAQTMAASGLSVVISDVRFDSEAKAIRREGGTVLRIEREGGQHDYHESEAGVSAELVSGVIENNGTEAEFVRAIGEAIHLAGFNSAQR